MKRIPLTALFATVVALLMAFFLAAGGSNASDGAAPPVVVVEEVEPVGTEETIDVGPDFNKGQPLPLEVNDELLDDALDRWARGDVPVPSKLKALEQRLSGGGGGGSSARSLASAGGSAESEEESEDESQGDEDEAAEEGFDESDEGSGGEGSGDESGTEDNGESDPGAEDETEASADVEENPVLLWLSADDVIGTVFPRFYELRGVGEHVEIWVATGIADPDFEIEGEETEDLSFFHGDCRNDRVEVTDEQIAYLIEEYETNMLPRMAEVFAAAPERDGSNAFLPAMMGLPEDYYAYGGSRNIILVDNIRDQNFYDYNNSEGLGFVAGFFYSVFNDYFDRNVITIDAWDWLHRTGPNPPHEPVPGNFCENAAAHPHFYESVIAHEDQHLRHSYVDADETIWLNEGLSTYAEVLTEYVDPRMSVEEIGFDDRTQCFLGYGVVQTHANPNPLFAGGAENGLTPWGDQGNGDELLCDYGAALTMLLFAEGRYGEDFIRTLFESDTSGLQSLEDALVAFAPGTTAWDLLHDWQAMVALDGVLDRGVRLRGGKRQDYMTDALHATINWENEDSYSSPGAPPNGADYVLLRNRNGKPLKMRQLRKLEFDGAEFLPSKPVEWIADDSFGGNPTLYSDAGDGFDRAIARVVDVPATGGTLTFDTYFQIEEDFDYGFVELFEDDPSSSVLLAWFTGVSNEWQSESIDLSAYAGKTVHIAFRYVTDESVAWPGWWVDDVALDGVLISDGSTLEGWATPTQISPVPVHGFNVTLIGYTPDSKRPAFIKTLALDENNRVEIKRRWWRRMLGPNTKLVAAIVSQEDPTESVADYAPYVLTVNGVMQPGGGS